MWNFFIIFPYVAAKNNTLEVFAIITSLQSQVTMAEKSSLLSCGPDVYN